MLSRIRVLVEQSLRSNTDIDDSELTDEKSQPPNGKNFLEKLNQLILLRFPFLCII